jgi:hypothetical protein
MKTYMLTGNPDNPPPDGMDAIRWEDDYKRQYEVRDGQKGDGSVLTEWQVNKGSRPGEQVILLRQGHTGIRGIIGFGLRCVGLPKKGSGRDELPVRFHNIRSLREEPFIGLDSMIKYGACRIEKNSNKPAYYKSGTEATGELLGIEKLCELELDLPLSILCSEPMAERLLVDNAARLVMSGSNFEEQQALEDLQSRTDLAPRTKKQLIDARIGQGCFRGRILLAELSCRVTGVSAPNHLRASHIKPWKESDDFERLDRNNGLMLSPHIDHLFDQGYMTFEPDGRMILAAEVPADVVSRWQLQQTVPPRPFSNQQTRYLNYHRANRFRR